MWLNCNVVKVNLETMLAGQRLSPRHAGLCGVAVQSSRANMCWHISALLCFVIIADHYYSLIVIAAGFAPAPPSPWRGKYGLW